MTQTAPVPEGLGTYAGYPIIDVKMEWRGISGGLSEAAAIEGARIVTAPDEDAFISARGRKISEDHDFVRDDEGNITGVVLIQVYKHVGVAFTDSFSASKAINETMERVAEAKAREKGSFDLQFGTPPAPEADPEQSEVDKAALDAAFGAAATAGIPLPGTIPLAERGPHGRSRRGAK